MTACSPQPSQDPRLDLEESTGIECISDTLRYGPGENHGSEERVEVGLEIAQKVSACGPYRTSGTYFWPGLDDSPHHPNPASNLHSDGESTASDPSEQGMYDFQQCSCLGQDDPRAEFLVYVRSAEVGLELADQIGRRNGNPSSSTMRPRYRVLDRGRS